MQEWSIGFLLTVLALAMLRIPWRRARSIRVESRIVTAAVRFDPLPPVPRPAPPQAAPSLRGRTEFRSPDRQNRRRRSRRASRSSCS